MRGRAALEKDYAKKLAGLTKTKCNDLGTVNSAWIVLKRETDAMAKAHNDFADRLTADCDNILKNYLTDTKKVRADIVKNGQKLLSDLDSNRKGNEKNKQAYAAARKKRDECQRQYDGLPSSTDPASIKVQKKLIAETKNADKSDDAYKKSVIKVQEVESRLYETEMPGWIQRMQELELERVEVVRRALGAYVECEEAMVPSIKQSFDAVSLSVNDINGESDILEFQNLKRSGCAIPAKTEYEPYDPALGTCRPAAGGGGMSSSPAASSPSSSSFSPANARPPALTTSSRPAVAASGGAAATMGMAASSAAVMSGGGGGGGGERKGSDYAVAKKGGDYVMAKYNYVAQESSELGFAQGDIIRVVSRDDSGWWVGELNGVQGDFPSNHVDEYHGSPPAAAAVAAPAPAAAAAAPAGTDYDQCTALYEYNAEDEGELSLAVGDRLTVEEEDDQGWYYGHNVASGAYGRYPSNYVKFD